MMAVVAVFLASCEDTLEIGKLPDESQYEDIYAKNGYLRDAKSNRVTNIIDLFTENYKTSVRLGLTKAPTVSSSVKVEVDAAYLEAYNKSKSNTGQQVALATTYLEPMGIYSSKYKKLSDLPKGATIALANNAANEARGLLLLQSAGLIKLKKNFDSASGNTNDIVSNPKKFKFKLIDDTTGPRIIKSVDAVLIGNTIALAGNLNVLKDSLYHEKIDQSTKNNINVLATAKKSKNNAAYKKLGKLYHNKQIQKWIAKKYSGTKVEVNKPVSYLTD